MRIVAILPLYLPDRRAGAELMIHGLLAVLAKRGHEVSVVAVPEARGEPRPRPRTYEVEGVRVTVCPLAALTTKVKPLAPEVVIGQLGAAQIAADTARRWGAKYVAVAHSHGPRTMRNLVETRPDLTICNTPLVHDLVRAHCAAAVILRPPVEPSAHTTTRGHRITLVNLQEHKGIELFYTIAGALPDLDFLGVVGGYGEQQTENAPPNVVIQPHTQDMRTDVWAQTRILLVPSMYESYGMVCLEAAASGIPVVASALPGIREAMGSSAVYLNQSDEDLWVRTVRRIATEPALEERLSRLSRDRSSEVQAATSGDLDRTARAIEFHGNS